MKDARQHGRRTKIVCTIGPATGSAGMIEKLIRAGMNVARLNLSHGTLTEHAGYVRSVRELSRALGRVVAVLIDLPGPKYRTGRLKGGQVVLKKGALLSFTTAPIEGDESRIPVNRHLPGDVKPGDMILLDDGAMMLRVLAVSGGEISCLVRVGGVLTENRGLVVPGRRPSGPFITDALRETLSFAVRLQPDFLALSFVTEPADVAGVRKLIAAQGANIPIIAKIERGEAVRNFEGILAQSDGIMVARGDLGVDIPLERVPLVQKKIIRRCNTAGKPVITATEMLESMVRSVRPTRAETTDVANAIFDGTDATMLSEETSIGEHPVQAVRFMDRIARETEKRLPYEAALSEKESWLEPKTQELISYNACVTAHNLGAGAIVAFTESGSTAGRVSKYRPRSPILAMTREEAVCRRLMLYWGVEPVRAARPRSISGLFSAASSLAKELGLAGPGEPIVITGGVPLGLAGTTNLLKVETV